MDIRIGIEGKIIAGKYEGWYILVEPSEWKGGTHYYIYLFDNDIPELTKVGYDYWCEDFETVEMYFELREWKVDWEYKKS
jgi:hypothetical protein